MALTASRPWHAPAAGAASVGIRCGGRPARRSAFRPACAAPHWPAPPDAPSACPCARSPPPRSPRHAPAAPCDRNLHHRQPQHIPHAARRGAAQMRVEHAVGLLQMPQHALRQPLRPRPVAGGQRSSARSARPNSDSIRPSPRTASRIATAALRAVTPLPPLSALLRALFPRPQRRISRASPAQGKPRP